MGIRSIFVIDPKSGKKYQYDSGDLRHIETAEVSMKQNKHLMKLNEVEDLLK